MSSTSITNRKESITPPVQFFHIRQQDGYPQISKEHTHTTSITTTTTTTTSKACIEIMVVYRSHHLTLCDQHAPPT